MALSRHLPIITNRMEFKRKKLLPSPSITQRIEFTGLSFGGSDSMLGAVETVTTSSIESSPGPEQEDSQSEDDDEGDDERGNGSRSMRIPKPQGEPGRPHSGGYSLTDVLKCWGDDRLKTITVGLFKLVFPVTRRLII